MTDNVFVYTVFGSTGEYEDVVEYAIASYMDEKRANAHGELATKMAEEWMKKRADRFEPIPDGWNEYDADMKMGVNGTRYFFVKTEIIDYSHFVAEKACK